MLEKLQRCMLHVAFDSDPICRAATITGTAARLGTAAHRVLEAIANGAVAIDADWNSVFEVLWQHEVHRQEQQALSTPHERHLGPARSWPYYGMQRAKLKRLAYNLWTRQQHRRQARPDRSLQAYPFTERHYEAFGGRLVGTADVVRTEQGDLLIEDYKTGAVTEVDAVTGELVARASYVQQLLLYAAMHHNTTGTWPVRGRLIPLDGEPVDIQIDSQQATERVILALNSLESYNKRLAGGTTVDALASPDPMTCRWCPYHGMCNPLWGYITETWNWERQSVECIVLTAISKPNNVVIADVQVLRGSVAPGVYRLDALHGLYSQRVLQEVGHIIRLSQLEVHDHHLRTTPSSILWLEPFGVDWVQAFPHE